MGDLTRNISRWEIACKCGCGLDTIDYKVLQAVQAIRDHFGARVDISSGARCEIHNMSEGGSPESQHLKCKAIDFTVVGVDPARVFKYLDYFWKGGLGKYSTFTHIDSRSVKARW